MSVFDPVLLQILSKLRENAMELFIDWESEKYGLTPFQSSPLVYHYTTGIGLHGILEHNCLWATNLSFMNDSQEMKYGLSVFLDAVENLIGLPTEQKRYGTMLPIFRNLLQNTRTTDVYACCFSSNGDQLSQWRGYTGETTGYSIGFEASQLVDALAKFATPISVIYPQENQESIALGIIDSFIDEFRYSDDEKIAGRADLDQLIAEQLLLEVEKFIVGFKHEGFWEEQEKRLFSVEDDLNSVKFREKEGVFVPYIEFQSNNRSALPIREIIISPTNDFERAEAGLRFLLDKHSYKDVVITKSEIPFRAR